MNILSRFRYPPFVLCNLRDPDDGAVAGGGTATEDPPAPTPAQVPAIPTEEPKPEGENLEAKVSSAQGIIGKLFNQLKDLHSRLSTAYSQQAKLEGQFNSAAAELKKEQGAHVTTQGLLSTANTTIAGLTIQRDTANGNVMRLEKLCSLKGIDADQAVPVPAENKNAANTGQAHYEKYLELKKTDSTKAMVYWRENQKAIDGYAASKR